MTLDLQMDPGLSVPVEIVGPDEQPLTDVEVTGFTSSGYAEKVAGGRFEATQFAPDETRTMLFQLKDQYLGWVARVSPRDAKNGPITVKLQPVATLTARLLHEDGSPMTGVEIQAWPLPSGSFAKRLPAVTTGADGRFQLTLLPGAAYSLQARGAGIDTLAEIARMLTVEPGETKDLGDLHLADRKFVPTATDDANAQRGKLINLRGLGPSAATVTYQPLETAEFTIEGLAPGRQRTLLVVHHQRGLGAQVVVTGDDTKPLRVRMTPTGTLTGRFVDKLGEPLPGIVVELVPHEPPLVGTGFWHGESDEDGRFRVTGLIADTAYGVYARPIQQPGPSLYVPSDVRVASGETLDLGVYTQENEYQYRRVSEQPGEPGGVE